MQITENQLGEATRRGLITPDQARALWAFLAEDAPGQEHDTPRFKAAHILYYMGGMIAIGAMTLFMTLGWESFGGGGLLVISLVYAMAALLLTEYLLERKHLALPAGITAVLAVVMVPLAVYGAQNAFGWWSDGSHAGAYRDYHRYIDWRWLMMELATLAAAAVALWRYRLPFLVMPVAVTLWYMSMDLVPMLLGGDGYSFFSDTGRLVSLWFGVAMTLLAFWVDLRTRHTRDFAFWLYLFGVLTFWGALSSMDSGSEFGKLIYCGINVVLIGIGAALSRRVFAVVGGFGLAGYLGHLSYTVFKDSLMFPLALTAIGLGVVGIGIWWQRHEAEIERAMQAWLPGAVRELVEARRR
ncbi:DUF2157 domain-containing protein [Ideonella sp. DXS29W]|uniref:DUF2157 domain-containing protein n=1 Tax=Ideonella lacteola TaxID=2984193 RepID=A0ABU9BJ39_9BURK